MSDSSLRAVGWARSLPLDTTVKAARDWAREHMQSLDWAESSPDTVDAALLTISELVTNAHVHAHSAADLVLTWDGSCLHVAVHDTSSHLPTPRPVDFERPNGRGMLLVDALSDTWQARPCPAGKIVHACFRPSKGDAGDGAGTG
ncbi:ATP-binding protein [Streptomyces sp. TG1A-8]|uniref:ATP-binding protein n=1 Tax=Streptomyces sp. TG1A-8 TaxID=3051385 RepID=UPI00265C2168|nr:ATP-binding protein [Streptomyces sp. TG1A-8]MDO0924405.1 ATP-binding protein [Streptomyces sp. TG1A-8]